MTDTSLFKFDIVPGDYQIFVSLQGYKTDTINLNVPLYFRAIIYQLIPHWYLKKFPREIFFQSKIFFLNSIVISLMIRQFRIWKFLKSILVNYPELTIEIAGYTDAKGSTVYNNKLADNRAQAVINYLTSSGISAARFVKKSFGMSNFVAINRNRDGSDNPEGREYNRRVTFGIVNPQTGLVIRQETYTPEHLRNPNSLKYSIVLLKTKKY